MSHLLRRFDFTIRRSSIKLQRTYRIRESNPYGFHRRILRPPRLPVPTILYMHQERFELSSPSGHSILSAACIPFHHWCLVQDKRFELLRDHSPEVLSLLCLPFHQSCRYKKPPALCRRFQDFFLRKSLLYTVISLHSKKLLVSEEKQQAMQFQISVIVHCVYSLS